MNLVEAALILEIIVRYRVRYEYSKLWRESSIIQAPKRCCYSFSLSSCRTQLSLLIKIKLCVCIYVCVSVYKFASGMHNCKQQIMTKVCMHVTPVLKGAMGGFNFEIDPR